MKKFEYPVVGLAVLVVLLSSCGLEKPSPVSDKSLEYFSNISVIDNDTFEKDSGKWEMLASGGIKDGVLLLLAKDWSPNIYKQQITDGQGIIIEFSYTEESYFEILFNYGEWGSDQYKRFGVYIDKNYVRPNCPPNNIGKEDVSGSFPLKPDTTYSIMMGISQGGDFLAIIRDPSDPIKVMKYHRVVGDNWSGYQWSFIIGGHNGTIIFDNFRAIKFDGIIEE